MPRRELTDAEKERRRESLARARATAAANREQRKLEPKVPVTQSQDFKAAVAAEVAAAEQRILAALAKQIVAEAPPAAATGDGLQQVMERLALTIGDLTNQNSGQKLVSPEVLAERRDAERKMHERIERAKDAVIAARQRGDEAAEIRAMPHYRLVAKIFAPLMDGDELIEPIRRGADNIVRPTELNWLLPPSLAMSPLNDPAREIFTLFKASIGNQVSTRVVSHKSIAGIGGKPVDGEPVYAANDERYMLTNQGHAVTAGSASLAKFSGLEASSEPVIDRGLARIRGQEPGRVHSGPPTIQVRVLGTIAPPAVQNG